MVATVGAVFAALGISSQLLAPEQAQSLHQLVSQAFLLGVLSLLVSAGCVGWLRGPRLGVVSAVIAAIGLIGLATVVTPFLRLQ
jgi:hypothetical protein